MEKKYNVIYADPPWSYKVWSKKGAGRSAESHYPTMSIEAIKALPVSRIAAEDCALFLWITFPMLREGWGVMDAWGFTFKTVAFVWVKQCRKSDNIFTGMGYWTRANAEICLLATRGHPKRAARDVKQVILEVFLGHLIENKFIRPKMRIYQTNNLYSALVRQYELEQEVRAIAGKNGKTRKTGRGKAQADPRRA